MAEGKQERISPWAIGTMTLQCSPGFSLPAHSQTLLYEKKREMGLAASGHRHLSGSELLLPLPPGSDHHSLPLPQLLFSPKWNAWLVGLFSGPF